MKQFIEAHTEELNGLYTSPDIVKTINSRRVREAELLACKDETRKVCVEDFKGQMSCRSRSTRENNKSKLKK
jgi:hypothetical protein